MDLKNDLIKIRLEKEEKLKELGINTRPDKYTTTHSIKEAMTLPEAVSYTHLTLPTKLEV